MAKRIVEVAREYEASSIVVPDLADIREIVETEVKAKAQEKVPDFVEGQKQYAKAYRVQVHRWSYHRLQEAVRTKAEQSGITVEVARQEFTGTQHEKAKALALRGYEKRISENVEMA